MGRVAGEVAQLAVDGEEVLGAAEAQEPPLLLLLRVPGGVQRPEILPEDLGASGHEPVHGAADGHLVAGDESRGEEHAVAGAHRQPGERPTGGAAQRAARLSLRAGDDDAGLPRLQIPGLLDRRELAGGESQVPHLHAEPDVLLHGAPHRDEPPAERAPGVGHLLDAVQVRGEAGHPDPPRRPVHGAADGRPHLRLGERVPGPVGVGGVGEEEANARSAQGLDAGEVGAPPVEGRVVDLEVAGVVDDALGRADRQRAGVGDGVGHRDELGRERRTLAGPDHLAVAHLAQVGVHARLLEPGTEQGEGEPRSVHRDRHVAQQERQRPQVVLVTVGEEDRAHPVAPIPQPGEVGGDGLDAEGLGREEEPAVDDGDAVLALDRQAVHADLAEAAQRGDPDRGRHPCNLPGPGRGASPRVAPGVCCGRRGPPGSHPRPPERCPARGRPARGRAPARARRGRLGQDPRHRPPHRPPDPGAGHRPVARARRHLHQQGGRGDAGAARRPPRPRGSRRLGADLPRLRRPLPAARGGAGRPAAVLRHLRRRRPEAAREAHPLRHGHLRRRPLRSARGALPDRSLEEPGPLALLGEFRGSRRGDGAEPGGLAPLRARAGPGRRGGLRGPPPAPGAAARGRRGPAGPLGDPLPPRARRRVPGHEPRPVPAPAPPLRGAPQRLRGGGRRPGHLPLARRRRGQHPRLRRGLPRHQGRQAGAELPLHRQRARGGPRRHLPGLATPREEALDHPRGRGAAGAAGGPGRARGGAAHRRRGRGRAPPGHTRRRESPSSTG